MVVCNVNLLKKKKEMTAAQTHSAEAESCADWPKVSSVNL